MPSEVRPAPHHRGCPRQWLNFTPLVTNKGGALQTQTPHWWLRGLYFPWSRTHYAWQMLNSRSYTLQEGVLNSWFEEGDKLGV